MSVRRVVMDVFFFQAEDGIRDADVTGVQTCALPICPLSSSARGTHGFSAECAPTEENPWVPRADEDQGRAEGVETPAGQGRSEERRVGKEGRSRWSPDH